MTNPLDHPILIAEDEDDEAFLLQRALKKAAITNPIHRVKMAKRPSSTLLVRARFPIAPSIRFPSSSCSI
jgi:hypothetical protein